MRLIDADNINFYCNYDGDCTGAIDKCKECSNYICNFKDIQEQPTAYDIDKVVEELEELKNKDICDYLDCDVCLYTNKCGVETDQSGKLKLDKAIEIVKQGGVSDDVCEWIQTSTAKYKTECGYKLEEYFDTKACYCKQCGKKIKVVE